MHGSEPGVYAPVSGLGSHHSRNKHESLKRVPAKTTPGKAGYVGFDVDLGEGATSGAGFGFWF